jgi:hypothetical protein
MIRVPALVLPFPEGRLSGRQRAALGIEILSTYVQARWLMRFRPLPDTVAALRSCRPVPEPAEPALVAGRIAFATVRIMRVLPTDSRCLARSLVVTALLARRGIPSRLVIGVQPAPTFAAHAWVEYEYEPLLPTTPDYQPLHRL